ncbi:PPOX class F420-dependent oxidoreductase [Pedococcus bigeumensis]|uniref:PPOX class F420-dependent oxidoreductase n=1 Tax=Pedococcus bigeumensis TaxID=433644 RepID=A0A502D4H8_9MICO|nr:PPOX class F420-dependent oxidoreductase [Pedococcus bigeumensis]
MASLGEEKFVSLTTFRKSGVGVPTTVWVGRDGDSLVVTTPSGSGKVKRLRNDERIELRPSSRRGTVNTSVPPVAGVAEVVEGFGATARLGEVMGAKYGLEYRIVMGVERLLRRGAPQRVMLRITPAADAA